MDILDKKYYEGMFGSLKHNILLMLNQIEGNREYSEVDIIPYLEIIESRIRDIKYDIPPTTDVPKYYLEMSEDAGTTYKTIMNSNNLKDFEEKTKELDDELLRWAIKDKEGKIINSCLIHKEIIGALGTDTSQEKSKLCKCLKCGASHYTKEKYVNFKCPMCNCLTLHSFLKDKKGCGKDYRSPLGDFAQICGEDGLCKECKAQEGGKE